MDKKPYETPVVRVVGSLQELTLLIQKQNNNTPDGYAYHGTVLTSYRPSGRMNWLSDAVNGS